MHPYSSDPSQRLGYKAILISTIVDVEGSKFDKPGYKAILISTIVDCIPLLT